MTSRSVSETLALKDAHLEVERAKVSNIMDRLRERTQYLKDLMDDMLDTTKAGRDDRPDHR